MSYHGRAGQGYGRGRGRGSGPFAPRNSNLPFSERVELPEGLRPSDVVGRSGGSNVKWLNRQSGGAMFEVDDDGVTVRATSQEVLDIGVELLMHQFDSIKRLGAFLPHGWARADATIAMSLTLRCGPPDATGGGAASTSLSVSRVGFPLINHCLAPPPLCGHVRCARLPAGRCPGVLQANGCGLHPAQAELRPAAACAVPAAHRCGQPSLIYH